MSRLDCCIVRLNSFTLIPSPQRNLGRRPRRQRWRSCAPSWLTRLESRISRESLVSNHSIVSVYILKSSPHLNACESLLKILLT